MSEEKDQIKASILDAYQKHLLRYGKNPISIFAFCEELEISEDDFYSHFRSFKNIENAIWKSFVSDTIYTLENDPEYEIYNAREKTLAFFYTFIEVLKQNRSFVLFRLENLNIVNKTLPFFLTDFFKAYADFMNGIIQEGIENQEVESRPLVTTHYVQGYKLLMGAVLKIWTSDQSEEYQTTDAAIEKLVNLSFDLLQKGPLDGMIDFVKFAYQHKFFL